MAHWHGLAKLRLHTDETLTYLDALTSELGECLRVFEKKTCTAFKTRELPRETRARARREVHQADKGKGKAWVVGNDTQSDKQMAKGVQPLTSTSSHKRSAFQTKSNQQAKAFNLRTYKAHSLGDYVEMIRRYGTVDSYNTEMVSQIV